MMNYIVIDLEFNQYFDFNDGRGQDEPSCPFEIIQLGAVKLNDSFELIDKINLFVRPQIFRRIHPFVHKITGISMAELELERSFEEVYTAFLNFIGSEKYVLCVWGSSDINLLYKNILFYKLNNKQLTRKYINVQALASKHLNQPPNCSIGLQAAVQKLGLSEELGFHDALNDAIYTAEVFRSVKNEGIVTEQFNISLLKQKTIAKVNRVNSGLLYAFCEQQLGRKLNDSEKELLIKVYAKGQMKSFDIHKPRAN